MKSYKIIDLFSGAGGMSSGFEMAGFRVSASIELMPKYALTHALNFPDCQTISGDITNISPLEFGLKTNITPGEPLIIIGGPPCQTFSNIGRSKIESVSKADIKLDPRNYLFKNYLEYVSYFKPDVFVMENVPNLKTRYNGEIFKKILEICEAEGYKISYSILDASHYGVPQKRKRLFIVGNRLEGDFSFAAETHKNNPRTVFDAISDLPIIHDGIRADELPYSKSELLTEFQLSMRNSTGLVGNNICRMSNVRAKQIFEFMKPGDNYMDLPPEVRKILPFQEGRFQDRLKRLVMEQPSWTILAHIGMDGYRYIHPSETRTLSVREAARIQSFPDHFKFVGNMREQYIQVGNSVPPLLAKSIADQVMILCQKK
ncbi:DNA cytosine methyltransferase [Pantoea sp. MQR6]|uniref:DNA cytosine methyltransferase n=1 Tax=Pantoea sp. MQR6 TaxID=2907307 RepID=UPI001FAB1976|nr:DNA cytosine methyltransferase [Pantoea sp. MQR6]